VLEEIRLRFPWGTIAVFRDVYKPAEDTWFLIDVLDRLKEEKTALKHEVCLDLGCGTGILGIYLLSRGVCSLTLFLDINPLAIANTAFNLAINNLHHHALVVLSDAEEEAFVRGSVDLVVANPPYLPSDKRGPQDPALIGGSKGYEAVVQFIDFAAKVLRKGGILLITYSSLSNPKVVESHLIEDFIIRKKRVRRFFFEELYVVEAVKR